MTHKTASFFTSCGSSNEKKDNCSNVLRKTAVMISYLNYVKPERIELIADEMIAIKSDIDRWRSQKANAAYSSVLNDGLEDDDE